VIQPGDKLQVRIDGTSHVMDADTFTVTAVKSSSPSRPQAAHRALYAVPRPKVPGNRHNARVEALRQSREAQRRKGHQRRRRQRSSATRRNLLTLLATVALMVVTAGCALFRPPPIVRHPQTPVLITEVSGSKIKVAVYDRENNSMIDAGWTEISGYAGWTLAPYDWEDYLERNADYADTETGR